MPNDQKKLERARSSFLKGYLVEQHYKEQHARIIDDDDGNVMRQKILSEKLRNSATML